MVAANILANGGQVAAVFNPAGSFHIAQTGAHAPFLASTSSPPRQLNEASQPAPSLATKARNLAAPVAAIALSGRVERPPSQQARLEARKVLHKPHQLPESRSRSGSRVSGSAVSGAFLQLLARMFAGAGLVVQRAAAADDAKVRMWRIGLASYVVSTLPDMLSYLLAPPAVLTVLSSVEPLLVSVLAILMLPQDAALLTSRQSLATAACVVGTLGTVLFAPSGAASLRGPGALAATEVSSHGIWEAAPGAEKLFEPSGAHRLFFYLSIVIPLFVYIARQVHKHKMAVLSIPCQQVSSFWLMLIAAMSLALQRLSLGVLGVSLNALHWQPYLVMSSPSILVTAVLAVLCIASCGYHVVLGVAEAPPHIFVPLYCATSMLMQLFHSMVIVREFRDESVEKVFLTLACAAITFGGVVSLCTSQCSKAGGLLQGSVYTTNCLEPILFDPSSITEIPLTPRRSSMPPNKSPFGQAEKPSMLPTFRPVLAAVRGVQ